MQRGGAWAGCKCLAGKVGDGTSPRCAGEMQSGPPQSQYFVLPGTPGPVTCLCPSVHEFIQPGFCAPPVPTLSTPLRSSLSSSLQLSPSVYLLHAGARLLKCCWRKSLILLQVYNHTPLQGIPILLLQEACVSSFRKICFGHSLSLSSHSLCSAVDLA